MSAGTGHDEHVLKLALIAFVGVDAVVAAEEHRHILGVDGTAEELDAVVQVVRDLDVVDGGTGANAGKGDAVDFVVLTNDRTTMVNADVRQDTRVVLGRTTTVRLTNDTFDAVCFGDGNSRAAIRSGDGSLAENDEATPKATRFGSIEVVGRGIKRVLGGKRDGFFGGTLGHDHGTLLDDERGGVHAGINLLGFDHGTGFNGEGGAVLDEYLAVEFVLDAGG